MLIRILEMTSEELVLYGQLRQEFGKHLGPGETEAFVLGISRGLVVATDDRAARKKIKERYPEIRLTDTGELLNRLVQMNAVDETRASELRHLLHLSDPNHR